MQGDPLSMVIYGLALSLLSEQLAKEVPELIQPWYADNTAMAGPASKIKVAVARLLELGPTQGYFPEPDKCGRLPLQQVKHGPRDTRTISV